MVLRLLHTLIDRRDILGIAATNLSSRLQSVLEDTTKLEAQNISAIEKNRELASLLVVLTKEIQSRKDEVRKNPKIKARLDELLDETTAARKKWKIMKSAVAAIVVGSGVNWAGNKDLEYLALNEEDEVD